MNQIPSLIANINYQKWDKYIRDFEMDKPVAELPEPGSDKEKFFLTGKNIYTTY